MMVNKEYDKEALGIKIRELRKLHKMKQTELAEKINITNKHLSRIENGDYPTTLNTIHAISNVFEVTLDDLLKTDINIYDQNIPLPDGVIKEIINEFELLPNEQKKQFISIVRGFTED